MHKVLSHFVAQLRRVDKLNRHGVLVASRDSGKDRPMGYEATVVLGLMGGEFWYGDERWLRVKVSLAPVSSLSEARVQGRQPCSRCTLEDNVSRPFKLKWCKQLMQLVDDLNLRYGIAHQDIVPRNLLVEEATDNLLLFDFDWSAQIGHNRGYSFVPYCTANIVDRDIRDDVRAVIFTIYEMITRDFHFREQDWRELDVSMIQDIEWVPHPDVTLDHPVAEYRAVLDAWVKTRQEGKKITIYTDAPEYIDWPVLEKPVIESTTDAGVVTKEQRYPVDRREALARGEQIVEWQRPMQSTLKGDYHLLATGKLAESI
ncbi:hypothetical protein C8A01DRAFT_50889 [Parachaetomium inaequale]|uniref:Protein kinase domain-containing protein n=1 Tax=Parachaetomium inaequale TaxID=2588326 RepID=A0AAN6PA64_9PEZI|nr:hypothetical protein C8A01DRAFT_50889 [Parachaetomium inaequale]